MTSEKVNDLEIVRLSDYFEPEKFRIIPAQAAAFPGGISEVPVELNLHSDIANKLTFDIRHLQKLFAFSIIGEKLGKINESSYYSPARKGKLKILELNDCGALWIFKIEMFDDSKKLYAVHAEDMIELLNNCRKPMFID